MIALFVLTGLLLACQKTTGNESTTLLLAYSRGNGTEQTEVTVPIWSAGINSTEEPEAPIPEFLGRLYVFGFYVAGICCFIFSIIGVIGNVISIIVLYSHEMWSSTSVFLIALAIYDTMLLVANVLLNSLKWLTLYTEYTSRFLFFVYIADTILPIVYSLAAIAHTGSIYAVVAVNVERYIAICHPLKAASYCTIRRAKKATFVVLILSLLYNIPRYMAFYWTWQWVPELNQTLLGITESDMLDSQEYRTVYLVYLNAVFKFIIPTVALLYLNISMVRRLYHTKPNLNKQARQGTEKERFSAIVLAVFVVFMIALTTAFVELILFDINSALTLAQCSEVCGYFAFVSQLVVVINSAINFILYCFFGRKFRRVFMTKCKCCRRR